MLSTSRASAQGGSVTSAQENDLPTNSGTVSLIIIILPGYKAACRRRRVGHVSVMTAGDTGCLGYWVSSNVSSGCYSHGHTGDSKRPGCFCAGVSANSLLDQCESAKPVRGAQYGSTASVKGFQ